MIDQPTTYSEELYLINNKTTVILSAPWNEIDDADKQLLQKILQSIRLNLASVRILHQPVLDLAQLKPQPARVIFFGDQNIRTENNVVLAPVLSQLQNDPAGKQKLWMALKQLFNL